MAATPSGTGAPRRLTIGLEFFVNEAWMGGTIYLRNLVYCLASLPEAERPEVRLLGVAAADHPMARELRSFPFVDPAGPPTPRRGTAARLWGRVRRRLLQRVLPPQPEWRGLDATYPGFGAKIAGVAQIHWIPDLQHIHLPHLFSEEERGARDAGMRRLAGTAGILVLSSEATRRDFLAAFPGARVEIRVWPFCTILTQHERNGADPHARYGVPAKYLYLPNQFWAHKNHITVLRALARLRRDGLVVPLVCTGLEGDQRNPEHMPMLRRFIAESGLEAQVQLLGLVPRNDQVEIFRHAAAVVQPSLFEGWSTVVEDTKAVGRPLLASDIAVHREQLADPAYAETAAFFAPVDDAALAARLAALWTHWRTGPDAEAEAQAATRTEARRLAAARAFIAIVREAVKQEGGPRA